MSPIQPQQRIPTGPSYLLIPHEPSPSQYDEVTGSLIPKPSVLTMVKSFQQYIQYIPGDHQFDPKQSLDRICLHFLVKCTFANWPKGLEITSDNCISR